jgi:hypothetical protein
LPLYIPVLISAGCEFEAVAAGMDYKRPVYIALLGAGLLIGGFDHAVCDHYGLLKFPLVDIMAGKQSEWAW